jgi:hypothetical protein
VQVIGGADAAEQRLVAIGHRLIASDSSIWYASRVPSAETA